jgi:hypothetical protein
MFDWLVWTPITTAMALKLLGLALLLIVANVIYTRRTGRDLGEDMKNGTVVPTPSRPHPNRPGYTEAERSDT